jgi:hypothetical protein
VQPTVYFLGAGVIGGFAVRLFVTSPAEWELSAAASRAGNEECMAGWFPFHPFYDSHDVWHFLSAAALFLSFMVSRSKFAYNVFPLFNELIKSQHMLILSEMREDIVV